MSMSSTKRAVNRTVERIFGHTIVQTHTVQDLKNELHQLRRKNQQNRDQRTDAESRLAEAESRLADAEKQLTAAETRITELKTQLDDANKQAKKSKPKSKPGLPADYAPEVSEIWPVVKPRTMIQHAKVNSLIEATRYISKTPIPGAVVECGVWRGGAMMAVAMMLDHLGEHDRELYLFDTYSGMPEAGERDIHIRSGQSAEDELAAPTTPARISQAAGLDDVQAGFASVDYPRERLHFVPGKVEDTVPEQAPGQIALLRLDTDWYASTKHELEQLYSRLVPGGVLIIDDYGSWQGSRDATDEFLASIGEPLLLTRVGRGRIAVKPGLDSQAS